MVIEGRWRIGSARRHRDIGFPGPAVKALLLAGSVNLGKHLVGNDQHGRIVEVDREREGHGAGSTGRR
jgi:hypothetical protein